ncbi:MAG: DUF554 domain-containing protein [Clostridia bacterium]|nr:DUF554 domain-containing protein [Clostridia bacterium]
MIGTLINFFAILLGTALGLLLRRGIPERLRDTIVQGQGLCVILVGLFSTFSADDAGVMIRADLTCVIVCMVIGSLAGAWINIEKRLGDLGSLIEKRFVPNAGEGSIAKGFVTASLVFCVGAMAIVGPMNSSLQGDHSTLISKSVLDGVFAIFFTSSLGVGVGLSALAVLVYQGIFALLAAWIRPILTPDMLTQMSAVGGLLIMGIGLNMIYDKHHIPVGNMLPAIFLPMAYIPIVGLFA